jgi:hypothetical protein
VCFVLKILKFPIFPLYSSSRSFEVVLWVVRIWNSQLLDFRVAKPSFPPSSSLDFFFFAVQRFCFTVKPTAFLGRFHSSSCLQAQICVQFANILLPSLLAKPRVPNLNFLFLPASSYGGESAFAVQSDQFTVAVLLLHINAQQIWATTQMFFI